jgi:hypothetical protein
MRRIAQRSRLTSGVWSKMRMELSQREIDGVVEVQRGFKDSVRQEDSEATARNVLCETLVASD